MNSNGFPRFSRQKKPTPNPVMNQSLVVEPRQRTVRRNPGGDDESKVDGWVATHPETIGGR